MKIYLIGFGLVFVGFCLGVLIAALFCAAGKRGKMEEGPFRPELLKVDHLRKWPDLPDSEQELKFDR